SPAVASPAVHPSPASTARCLEYSAVSPRRILLQDALVRPVAVILTERFSQARAREPQAGRNTGRPMPSPVLEIVPEIDAEKGSREPGGVGRRTTRRLAYGRWSSGTSIARISGRTARISVPFIPPRPPPGWVLPSTTVRPTPIVTVVLSSVFRSSDVALGSGVDPP